MNSSFIEKSSSLFNVIDKVSKTFEIAEKVSKNFEAGIKASEIINNAQKSTKAIGSINEFGFINFNDSFHSKYINEIIKVVPGTKMVNINELSSYKALSKTLKLDKVFNSQLNDVSIKNHATHIIPKTFIPKSNLEELAHIDINISQIKLSLKKDELMSSRLRDSKTPNFYTDSQKLFNQLRILEECILNNLDYQDYIYDDTFFCENDYREWKEKRREQLEKLLKKFVKLKLNITQKLKSINFNFRETFRKIYNFYFKNLDDTDSLALIFQTY